MPEIIIATFKDSAGALKGNPISFDGKVFSTPNHSKAMNIKDIVLLEEKGYISWVKEEYKNVIYQKYSEENKKIEKKEIPVNNVNMKYAVFGEEEHVVFRTDNIENIGIKQKDDIVFNKREEPKPTKELIFLNIGGMFITATGAIVLIFFLFSIVIK